MPANIVKPGQEGKWARAKAAAHEQYPGMEQKDKDRFYSVVTTIFKNMTQETRMGQHEGAVLHEAAKRDVIGTAIDYLYERGPGALEEAVSIALGRSTVAEDFEPRRQRTQRWLLPDQDKVNRFLGLLADKLGAEASSVEPNTMNTAPGFIVTVTGDFSVGDIASLAGPLVGYPVGGPNDAAEEVDEDPEDAGDIAAEPVAEAAGVPKLQAGEKYWAVNIDDHGVVKAGRGFAAFEDAHDDKDRMKMGGTRRVAVTVAKTQDEAIAKARRAWGK